MVLTDLPKLDHYLVHTSHHYPPFILIKVRMPSVELDAIEYGAKHDLDRCLPGISLLPGSWLSLTTLSLNEADELRKIGNSRPSLCIIHDAESFLELFSFPSLRS